MEEYRKTCRDHRLRGEYTAALMLTPGGNTLPHTTTVASQIQLVETLTTAQDGGLYNFITDESTVSLADIKLDEEYARRFYVALVNLKVKYMTSLRTFDFKTAYEEAGEIYEDWEAYFIKMTALGQDVDRHDVMDVRMTYFRIALMASKYHYGYIPPTADTAFSFLRCLNEETVSLPADAGLVLSILDCIGNALLTLRPFGIGNVAVDTDKWAEVVEKITSNKDIPVLIRGHAAHIASKYPYLLRDPQDAPWYLQQAALCYEEGNHKYALHEVRVAQLCRKMTWQVPLNAMHHPQLDQTKDHMKELANGPNKQHLFNALMSMVGLLQEFSPELHIWIACREILEEYMTEISDASANLPKIVLFCKATEIITKPPWCLPEATASLALTLMEQLKRIIAQKRDNNCIWLAGKMALEIAKAMQIFEISLRKKKQRPVGFDSKVEDIGGSLKWASYCFNTWTECSPVDQINRLEPFFGPLVANGNMSRSDKASLSQRFGWCEPSIKQDLEMGNVMDAWAKEMALARIKLASCLGKMQLGKYPSVDTSSGGSSTSSTTSSDDSDYATESKLKSALMSIIRYALSPHKESGSESDHDPSGDGDAVTRKCKGKGKGVDTDDKDIDKDIDKDKEPDMESVSNHSNVSSSDFECIFSGKDLIECYEALPAIISHRVPGPQPGAMVPAMTKHQQRLCAEELAREYYLVACFIASSFNSALNLYLEIGPIFTHVDTLSKQYGVHPRYAIELSYRYFTLASAQCLQQFSLGLHQECISVATIAGAAADNAGVAESLMNIRTGHAHLLAQAACNGLVNPAMALRSIEDAEQLKKEMRVQSSIIALHANPPCWDAMKFRQQLSKYDTELFESRLCNLAFEMSLASIRDTAENHCPDSMLIAQGECLWVMVQMYKSTGISDFFVQGILYPKQNSHAINVDKAAKDLLHCEHVAFEKVNNLEATKKRDAQIELDAIHEKMSASDSLKKLMDAWTGKPLELKEVYQMYRQMRGNMGHENIVFVDWAYCQQDVFLVTVRNEELPAVFICDVSYDDLCLWIKQHGSSKLAVDGTSTPSAPTRNPCYLPLDQSPESSHCLRKLDALVTPLLKTSAPKDLLVLSPWRYLASIPLHALWIEPDTPLILRNPCVYTPSLTTLTRCWARTKAPQRLSPDVTVMQAQAEISVPPSGPLHAGATIINPRHCTERRFLNAVEHSRIIDFYGHVAREDKSVYPNANVLVLPEKNSSIPVQRVFEIPTKWPHLTIIAGEAGDPVDVEEDDETQEDEKDEEETESDVDFDKEEHQWRLNSGNFYLYTGLLTAGVGSVLGTLWPIGPNREAVRTVVPGFYKAIAGQDGNVKNLAIAFQEAVLAVRQRKSARPCDWLPFMLTGSPILACPAKAKTKAKKGGEASGSVGVGKGKKDAISGGGDAAQKGTQEEEEKMEKCKHEMEKLVADNALVRWTCNVCYRGPIWTVFKCKICSLQRCETCNGRKRILVDRRDVQGEYR